MPSNARTSTVILGLSCAVLLGAGSLLIGREGRAAGPPGGLDVRVINASTQPVPVVGEVIAEISGPVQAQQQGPWVVGSEQVGPWSVSLDGGIGIDPGQNEVSIQKGTRRLLFHEFSLDDDDPDQSVNVDVRGSTKIRVAITVNGSSGDVDVSLVSKLTGATLGSILDFFETGNSVASRTRVYDLPGEEVGIRVRQDDGFHQVFLTVWGD